MSTESDPASTDTKRMRLRYAGPCRTCGVRIEAGTHALYHRPSKTVSCLLCDSETTAEVGACADSVGGGGSAAPPPVTALDESTSEIDGLGTSEGVAGGSARREFERRHAARDQRVRKRFPRAGGLLLAVTSDPQSTRAWDVGAVGEEQLGGMLTRMAGPSLRVLHDRRIPGTQANIDHMVVCPSGVFVIDAKHYKGRLELRVEGGLLRPRVEKLVIGGRDRTKLVDGVLKQIALVTGAVGTVPVSGMLCFVDGNFPLLSGAFATRGVSVVWPKRMAKMLRAPGPLGARDIEQLRHQLAEAFPSHQ